MHEQRRHQRIRFNPSPLVRLGQTGRAGTGTLENLSLGGLMVRTSLPLEVGKPFGCEFSVFDSPCIDMAAEVVNRVGDCFGARFQAGPLSACLIQESIDSALAVGRASVLSVNEMQGCKVMRVAGGLNASVHDDFMYGLIRCRVAALDLSEVTRIDREGAELCRMAVAQYGVRILNPSLSVMAMMDGETSILSCLGRGN